MKNSNFEFSRDLSHTRICYIDKFISYTSKINSKLFIVRITTRNSRHVGDPDPRSSFRVTTTRRKEWNSNKERFAWMDREDCYSLQVNGEYIRVMRSPA